MNIKELASKKWSESTLSKIYPDNGAEKDMFMTGFEIGFQFGNIMPQISIKPIYVFKDEMLQNQQLRDIICMQNRISQIQYNQLLEEFCLEQMALQRTYKEISEVNSHFRNWAKINAFRLKPTSNKTNKL
jgi:hypothetical protein